MLHFASHRGRDIQSQYPLEYAGDQEWTIKSGHEETSSSMRPCARSANEYGIYTSSVPQLDTQLTARVSQRAHNIYMHIARNINPISHPSRRPRFVEIGDGHRGKLGSYRITPYTICPRPTITNSSYIILSRWSLSSTANSTRGEQISPVIIQTARRRRPSLLCSRPAIHTSS